MTRKPTRPEKGTITKRHGAWFWRHYVEGVQVWTRLCDDNAEFRNKADVLPLVREMIKREAPGRPRGNAEIVAYASDEFFPWIKANRSPATYGGYMKIWTKHLAGHFGKTRMFDYTSRDASRFLNDLAPKMTRISLGHVRALMSAIFSHAHEQYGVSNPMRDVTLKGIRTKSKPAQETPEYTAQEIRQALAALEGEPIAQLVMALAFFAGLMPSELLGLRWDDILPDFSVLTVRRALWNGQVTEAKNEWRKAPIPVMEPLRGMLRAYESTLPVIAERQHVITNSLLRPCYSLNNLRNRVIKPAFERAGLDFKAFYAGRRGIGTLLYEKSPQAAQGVLRHKDQNTTRRFYVKKIERATFDAMSEIENDFKQATNERQLAADFSEVVLN